MRIKARIERLKDSLKKLNQPDDIERARLENMTEQELDDRLKELAWILYDVSGEDYDDMTEEKREALFKEESIQNDSEVCRHAIKTKV